MAFAQDCARLRRHGGRRQPDRPTGSNRMLPATNSLSRGIHLGAAIGVGVVVLVAAARLLRLAEFDEAFDRVLRRLRSAG